MQVIEHVKARCAECGWIGEAPAIAVCPTCSSRQLRAWSESEQLLADAVETIDGLREAFQNVAQTFCDIGAVDAARGAIAARRSAESVVARYRAWLAKRN